MAKLSPVQQALKRIYSRQEKTQPQLAQELGVSLATTKRWLQGKGIALDDLSRLLTLMGSSLREFAASIEAPSQQFAYTLVQEEALAKEPGLLAYFDFLLNGRNPQQIKKIFALTSKANFHYLFNLDKIGLIKLLPGEGAKLLVSGEPKWRKHGPLSQKFRQTAVQEFISQGIGDGKAMRFGIYYLEKAAELELTKRIEELYSLAKELESRTRARSNIADLVPLGMLCAFKSFEWSLLRKIPRS